MTISKKEGSRPQGRQRFRNIPAGIYENAATDKVIVIISDSEYYFGHIRIRQGKPHNSKELRGRYKYASWRQGKKIKEKYLGVIWKPKVPACRQAG